MKTFYAILFMSFSLLLTSCENEKSEIPMPNYKVLGVNSFTIDGVAYTATDGLLLNTGGTSSIALVGMTTSSSTLHSDVEYAIYSKTGVDLSVSVRSIYSDVSIYKAFTHQHLKEITQSVKTLQADFQNSINFIPYRGNFTRGIMANVYTKFKGSIEEALELYKNYYQNHPFTHVSEASEIDLKQVVNTNKCVLHLEKHGDNLLISSVIDNLTKGASGQAVQNLNLIFSLAILTFNRF